MATTITQGASTITPTVVLGWQGNREAQTIIHYVLGDAVPDATLRPASRHSGRLSLGFQGASSETNSKTAETLLSGAVGSFTLVSTERSSLNMVFVVTGTITRELEDATRDAWIVSFDFQEVS